LIFSFLIAVKVLTASGKILHSVYDLFLVGILLGFENKEENPLNKYIDDKNWNLLCSFIYLDEKLKDLTKNINKTKILWEDWLEQDDLHKSPMPYPYENLDIFTKLCIIKCVRAEKVIFLIQEFVSVELGKYYVE